MVRKVPRASAGFSRFAASPVPAAPPAPTVTWALDGPDEVLSWTAAPGTFAIDRYEVRRLCAWFDDKSNAEATRPVMNERVWKKVMRQGYPDSRTVKAGLGAIRRHMDYMRSLLEHRRWLAGDTMTLADFTAAAHLSCLDYISDVDWTHSTEVQEWYAKIKSRPAFRSLLADHLPGVHPAPHYALLDF